jgi:hypothetical protein
VRIVKGVLWTVAGVTAWVVYTKTADALDRMVIEDRIAKSRADTSPRWTDVNRWENPDGTPRRRR